MIVDECHLVNPKEGMYRDFFKAIRCKIIGLTATPYRLYSTRNGAVLRFITNTSPRVFSRLLFFVQIGYLFGQGYLAKLNYYPHPADRSEPVAQEFDRGRLYGRLRAARV